MIACRPEILTVTGTAILPGLRSSLGLARGLWASLPTQQSLAAVAGRRIVRSAIRDDPRTDRPEPEPLAPPELPALPFIKFMTAGVAPPHGGATPGTLRDYLVKYQYSGYRVNSGLNVTLCSLLATAWIV